MFLYILFGYQDTCNGNAKVESLKINGILSQVISKRINRFLTTPIYCLVIKIPAKAMQRYTL